MVRAHHDGKGPSQRQLRVGEELRHVIARTMERGDIRDPVLTRQLVTVTEVRVSPDLTNATVFVVPHRDSDAQAVLDSLERLTPYLRRKIAEQVRLRMVPKLSFESDVSFAQAARIEELLHSPEVRRDLDSREDLRKPDSDEP